MHLLRCLEADETWQTTPCSFVLAVDTPVEMLVRNDMLMLQQCCPEAPYASIASDHWFSPLWGFTKRPAIRGMHLQSSKSASPLMGCSNRRVFVVPATPESEWSIGCVELVKHDHKYLVSDSYLRQGSEDDRAAPQEQQKLTASLLANGYAHVVQGS
eukprot:6303553-Amphidinium_carterae.1